ncbi:MAG: peptidoglycan DD-metalloendopeptidase family protein [Candidatus Margulisiibacteriota bacterium]
MPVLAQNKTASDELLEKREQLSKVYQELEQSKARLQRTEREQKNVVQQLFTINRDLKKTEGQLTRAEQQKQANERKINFLKVSLDETKKKLNERSRLLKDRIKEVYKSGGLNYLQLFLSADTLGDFISRTYFFEKILARDTHIADEISSEYSKISSSKTQVEGVAEEIKLLASYIQHKKKDIERQALEKQKANQALEARRKDYEKKIEELEQTSNEIEKHIQKLVAERAAKGIVVKGGTGHFIWPLRGRLTSSFGYRRSPFSRRTQHHTGQDIANSYGTPIKAADGGEVIFAGWWGGYGKAIIIDHGRGLSTVYGHTSRIYVQKDQKVEKGQVIALVGSTGFSTGPHLHFEVRKNGVPQNPIKWLP